MHTLKSSLALTFVSMLLIPQIAAAQQVKSPVVGVIKSGANRGYLSVGDPTHVIIRAADPPSTTDNSKVLVVTQVCFAYQGSIPAEAFPILFVGDKQFIVPTGCTDFNPGLVVPAGADVDCENGGAAATISCAVIGVVTAKAP